MTEESRLALEELVKSYPKSEAAKTAKTRLAELDKAKKKPRPSRPAPRNRACSGGAEEGKQMRLRQLALAALALLLVPFVAGAAPKKVVLLFTGDNGGEIAPCG